MFRTLVDALDPPSLLVVFDTCMNTQLLGILSPPLSSIPTSPDDRVPSRTQEQIDIPVVFFALVHMQRSQVDTPC